MMPLSLNKTLILLLLIVISSCESKSDQVNKNFIKKYGLEVKGINSRRAKEKNAAGVRNEGSWNSDGKDFLPNVGGFSGSRSPILPDDMFMIRYNLFNSPDSYGRQRLSFDDIQIPAQDAFGVVSDLGEKNYQLIDGQTLQKDVDFSRSKKEKYDDEISLKLIGEEKERKRKEYLEKQAQEKRSQDKKVQEIKSKEEESQEKKSAEIDIKEEKNDKTKTEDKTKTTE